jgi:hypothetical protein
LKIGSLNYIINIIRDLKNTHTLVIENCVINNSNIDSIAFYIKWKSKLWKELRFINCGLNEKDLKKLLYFRMPEPFFSWNYDIDDIKNWVLTEFNYPKLELLDISSNPSISNKSEIVLEILYFMKIRGIDKQTRQNLEKLFQKQIKILSG